MSGQGVSAQVTAAQPRRWLRRLSITLALAGVLCLLAITGLWLYFDNAYFKQHIETALKESLGRDVQSGPVTVNFWKDSLSIESLRILNASAGFKDQDTFRCRKTTIKVALWPLLTSGFTKIRDIRIELYKPEVILEQQENETTNIEDWFKKLALGPRGAWLKDTGLKTLNYQLAIHEGAASFTSGDPKLDVIRLEGLEVDARMDALGAPSKFTLQGALATPKLSAPGQFHLAGQVNWIDSAGVIDPHAFTVKLVPGGSLRFAAAAPEAGVDLVIGEVKADSRRLFCQRMIVAMGYKPAPASAEENYSFQLSLDVTPKAPGETLWGALLAPGLPLVIEAPIRAETPISSNVIDALKALSAAILPKSTQAKAFDLNDLKNLRVSTSLQASAFTVGTATVRNVNLFNVALDDLNVAFCGAKGELLTPEKPMPGEYQCSCRFNAGGTLDIHGYPPAWRGSGNIGVCSLTVIENGSEKHEEDWEKLASQWAQRHPQQSGWQEIGLLLDFIYGDKFGLFLDKMEGDPFGITFTIDNGQLSVAHGEIAGLADTRSAGIQVDYEGGIYLPTLQFQPEFLLWLTKLPQKTQRILRLDQLAESERKRILGEIEQRKKLVPVKFKGRKMDNVLAFLTAFLELRSEIGKLLEAKN